MSEAEKLNARLDKMFSEGMKNLHVQWSDEAASLTPEERAKALNEFLDAQSTPVESIDNDTPKIRYDAPFEGKS